MRGRWPLILALAACHTPPAISDPLAPRPVVEVQRYVVSKQGQRLGMLAQREIRDPQGTIGYYLVENAAGQWLGYADAHGRFYRYEPFAERERFLGVYPMHEGLGLLYDVAAPLQIEPAARATAHEASANRNTKP